MPFVDYHEFYYKRLREKPELRDGMILEAFQCFINDEVDIGKAILKDVIKATVGFEAISQKLGKKPESLVRMFSASGNPTITNFFAVLNCLRESQGFQLELQVGEHSPTQDVKHS